MLTHAAADLISQLQQSNGDILWKLQVSNIVGTYSKYENMYNKYKRTFLSIYPKE